MEINVTIILSTQLKEARRMLKIQRLGKDDVREVYEAAPYGVDSNPVKDMRAIYASTSVSGDNVIIGYINTQQLADVGEMRTYSTDENGNVVFFIHQKNDGTCLIGGDADNMVRYSKLETAFNSLKDTVNNLITKYNALLADYKLHVHSGVTSGSSASGPPAPPHTGTNAASSNADISPAKIDEIKTL